MKQRSKLIAVVLICIVALGTGLRRSMSQVFTPFGFQQSTGRLTPTVIGPGMAPNVGTAVDPRSLSYYGDYYEENLNPTANRGNSAPRNIYNVTFGPADIPRTSDAISVKLNGTNSIAFRWDGEPRAIKSMTFSVLDKRNQVISTQKIYRAPVRSNIARTSAATGYTVTVEYINGMTTKITAPL